ncbi:hypothetical protein FHU41_002069 [Psychromicrobium silvestre]|uniref:Transglycosylase SLT domain n=1 Tax=Psychromicrobium silvestre TaxID=1645614 RepID=A0A7Y9LUJ1_9MICC|nr:hypothetical protein [Psychromicrobium silvestre]
MASKAKSSGRHSARHAAAPEAASTLEQNSRVSGRRRAAPQKSTFGYLLEAAPKLPLKRVAAVAVAGVLIAGVSASQQAATPTITPVADKTAAETISAAPDAAVSFTRVATSSQIDKSTQKTNAASSEIKTINDPEAAQAFAASKLSGFGWGQDQMSCLTQLWNRESSWQTTAENPSSLAYGIAQSLPAEKMASTGADYRTNYKTQIIWGLGYIEERYGSPCGAWGHSQATGWY